MHGIAGLSSVWLSDLSELHPPTVPIHQLNMFWLEDGPLLISMGERGERVKAPTRAFQSVIEEFCACLAPWGEQNVTTREASPDES